MWVRPVYQAMSSFDLKKLALDFANHLIAGEFDLASKMVAPAKSSEFNETWIASEYEEMIEYGDGKPNHIEVMTQDSMNNWPAKQDNDLGWVYVAICGDGYSEAVAVIFNAHESMPMIREIEWGRP